MAKEWAKTFYNSRQWQTTRNAYYTYRQGLCERCLINNKITVGEIVHHKIYITTKNINDVNITLNWKNLMLVCRGCHNILHGNIPVIEEGLMFNENGDVVYDN